ncbi:MAG: carbon-nitrogen hydrolase family protein [Verrucomicrobiota bacterium]
MPALPSLSTLRVAAVQMIFAGSPDANLARLQSAAREAAGAGANAVLFPECATTGYAIDFDALDPGTILDTLRQVAHLAGTLGIHLLVGSPVPVGRRLYNALLVFDPKGRLAHAYAKCQLTPADQRWFTPGDGLSLFRLGTHPATAFICHERRYPELVRLPVMAGAKVVFHPNAGLDALAVSRTKRRGRDGMVVRAFENAVFYVFANSVGPQGGGKWSAGDSKIVAPDGTLLGLADNRGEAVLVADLDLARATRKYARESLLHPRFLAVHWRRMLADARPRIRAFDQQVRRALAMPPSAGAR